MATYGDIRFCTAADGTRIAFAVCGGGEPVLIMGAQNSTDHLDGPAIGSRHWVDAIRQRFRCVRMDVRGIGLSQPDIGELTPETWAQDVDAVLDAAGLAQVSLLALSNGAVGAVHYAATRPARVARLVVYGGYARGRLHRGLTRDQESEVRAAMQLLEVGLQKGGTYGEQFRTMFYRQHFPDESLAFYREMDQETLRRLTPAAAARYVAMLFDQDVSADAQRVTCPTLVLHGRQDGHTPLAEAARLAGLVPGARFVVIESANTVALPGEPAWTQVQQDICGFLGAGMRTSAATVTARQRQVLQAVAAGRTDKQIARELELSPRTIEMHVAGALKALGCATRAEAVARAVEAGLLD
jgi:pimeloyl-ACP methyl ester carboxylesterase